MARRTPALCHTSIPDPPAVNRGSTLDVQPFPVRTLLAQRTRCCRVENWNPEEPSHKLQRMKGKCKGEDGVESTWEVSPRPNRGGFIEGGAALFIAKPPPHVAPHRGGERGLKDGGGRTKSQLCNRLGRAHLWRSGSRRRVHLCTRRSRRGHLWPTRVKADAGMTWPTRASLDARHRQTRA